MMTPRTLRWIAFGIALSVQAGMVVTYGMITDWCFCSHSGSPSPPMPPVFVLRFLDLSVLPAAWMMKGMGAPVLFVVNLEAWFFGVLALLHGMCFAGRIRIRLPRHVTPHGGRIGLAGRESVRARQLVVMAAMLVTAGMAAGAQYRRWWLAEAERVFAAAMADASTGRPLAPGVELSMYATRGGEYSPAIPETVYVAEPDPHRSGDHPLDAFVAPYTYAGTVRFASGTAYEFSVLRQEDGWIVHVHPAIRWP